MNGVLLSVMSLETLSLHGYELAAQTIGEYTVPSSKVNQYDQQGIVSHRIDLREPVVLEITFHGTCSIPTAYTELYLRIMVKNHLLLGEDIGVNLQDRNKIGGAYMFSGRVAVNSWFQCSKTDWLYLLGKGFYDVKVVAATNGTAKITGGFLMIKSTRLSLNNDIGLPITTF